MVARFFVFSSMTMVDATPVVQHRLPSDYSEKLGTGSMPTSQYNNIPQIPLLDLSKSGWKKPTLRQVPIYHPTDMCNNKLSLDNYQLSQILGNITECLRLMSIQANFFDDPVSAALLTTENIELHLSMWKSRTDNEVIIEVQRRRGDSLLFSRYARRIIDAAATETFDAKEYKVDTALDFRFLQQTELVINSAVASMPIPGSSSQQESSDREQTFVAIDIVHSFLSSERLDARQLGLESLCVLTDPRRTSISTAVTAALAVLLGQAPTPETETACRTIHQVVMKLVQLREFGDGDNLFDDDSMGMDSDAQNVFPSEDEGTKKAARPPEYVAFMSQMFHLALTTMVNAIEVVASFQDHEFLQGMKAEEMAAKFLESARSNCRNADMLQTLIDCVSRAERNQQIAFLSSKGLKFLGGASPLIREFLRRNSEHVAKAYHVGCNSHDLLQTECNQLWIVLHSK
jgi:hypothetical protein